MNNDKDIDEKDLKELIEWRVQIATNHTKSKDEVVQIAWLADGIDIWHKSDGKRGHSPEQARHYIISSITRLLQSERNKTLEMVRGALPDCDSGCEHKDTHQGHGSIWWQGYNQALDDISANLNKLDSKGE